MEELGGCWFWGGSLYNHFGHFLVESLARLWALDEMPGRPPDGILYVPKRPRQPASLAPFQKDVLAAFGVHSPVRVVNRPARVEEIVVAGQGFGLGRIARGTPEMRRAVRRRFGAAIAPAGPERLFVSRSRTGAAGGIAGETILEALLEAEGYEVFHPQENSVDVQIARYKAAQQIIIVDGSAAHLYAYVGRETQQVVYLPRRTTWTEGPTEHIASFAGVRPLVPKTLLREWIPVDTTLYRGVSFALHDLAELQAVLRTAGFVGAGPSWRRIGEEEAEDYVRSVAPQIAFDSR